MQRALTEYLQGLDADDLRAGLRPLPPVPDDLDGQIAVARQVAVQRRCAKPATEALRPVKAALAEVTSRFSAVAKARDDMLAAVRERVVEALEAHYHAGARLSQEAAALAAAGQHAEASLRIAEIPALPDLTGVQVRRVKELDIDPSLLPRELMQPNMGAIKTAIAMGEEDIPGVRWVEGFAVAFTGGGDQCDT